jgi:hypothetical protein
MTRAAMVVSGAVTCCGGGTGGAVLLVESTPATRAARPDETVGLPRRRPSNTVESGIPTALG